MDKLTEENLLNINGLNILKSNLETAIFKVGDKYNYNFRL